MYGVTIKEEAVLVHSNFNVDFLLKFFFFCFVSFSPGSRDVLAQEHVLLFAGGLGPQHPAVFQ